MKLNHESVQQYLHEHPEVLSDFLAVGSDSPPKVMDFRAAQLAKLQADNHSLNQRQMQWVGALQQNQQLAQKLWGSAAALARANGYKAILSAVDDLLCEQLNFPAYALKIMPAANKRAIPAQCVLQDAVCIDTQQIQACAHLPLAMQTWFANIYESHLLVPLVWNEQALGYWVIASETADYFQPDMDTSYMQDFAAVLAASLARLMGVAN